MKQKQFDLHAIKSGTKIAGLQFDMLSSGIWYVLCYLKA